jgi:hypothetical protein
VQFEPRLKQGIRDGTITLAFRRWRRSQVVTGHQYRTGLGMALAEAVDVVRPSDITAADALAAGYPDVAGLLADLRGDQELPLYRIRFRRLDEPDPRDELAASDAITEAEATAIGVKLARMDAVSKRGPWTATMLSQIAAQPGVVSTVLAEQIGWPRPEYKLHVRRLKEMGLTISLDIGYKISPRGAAYLGRSRPPAKRGTVSKPGRIA